MIPNSPKKFKEQLDRCNQVIDSVCQKINVQKLHSVQINYSQLYNELYSLASLIPDKYLIFKNHLRDHILPELKLKDTTGYNPYGIPVMIPQNGINPYFFGQVLATMSYLNEMVSRNESTSIWDTMHPRIMSVSQKLFEDGHYANAVEDAFKEVNIRVKNIYKERTSIEKDGSKLMQSAFSVANPIIKISELDTQTGKDIQQGNMELFVGAILCGRNPKAHEIQMMQKEDAIRELNFASMLMFRIDNELK